MTDCDSIFDAEPGDRERHLAVCLACAQLHRALHQAAAPAPAPLTSDFWARLDLAQERPDPIPIWTRTVERVRQGLTVAAAITASIATGWVAREAPAAWQLTDHQIDLVIQRARYR